MTTKPIKSSIIALIIMSFFVGLGIFVFYVPQSVLDTLANSGPDDHYENGVIIRTIRGKEYIVSGFGEHESLTPVQEDVRPIIIQTNFLKVAN